MATPTWNSDEEGWPNDDAGPEWEMFKDSLRKERNVPRRVAREALSRCIKCGVQQKLDWNFVKHGNSRVYSERLLVGRCPACHYEEALE